MIELDDFIARYVATWNESDADIRRAHIEGLWSEQASLFNRVSEYHGLPGIEQAVKRSYDLFVARGFQFRPRGDPANHHNAVRFSWDMITADDKVDSVGMQFLVLDENGQIRLDYQFIEGVTTA
jgi:hypothetical protein